MYPQMLWVLKGGSRLGYFISGFRLIKLVVSPTCMETSIYRQYWECIVTMRHTMLRFLFRYKFNLILVYFWAKRFSFKWKAANYFSFIY